MISYARIIKRIKKSSNIFVMGHKAIDFDSLGACMGINELCRRLRKKCYIILEDDKFDDNIENALEYINDNNIKCSITKFSKVKEHIKEESLMIIVDTYNESRSQVPKACSLFNNLIFIDHHLFGEPINNNYFIDAKVSSICEILAHLFRNKKIKLDKLVANLLLAGIVVDSNSFSHKTTSKTHEAASFLLKSGADINIMNNFTKTNIADYIKLQKIIFKTEFYKKKYAIVVGDKNTIYERKDLAIISDSLLLFDNVEASFAIGFLDKKTIGVSCRSLTMDVDAIMKKFAGGGHQNNAACQIEDKSLEEVLKMIKGELT